MPRESAAMRAARKRYRELNWGHREPVVIDGMRVAVIESGDHLVALGRLVAVTYQSDKGGETEHWVHDFRDELPILAEHQPSGDLVIVGGSYRVTRRGIVG